MAHFPDLAFFVELVKQGSLAALARAWNVTPPAISMRLNQLEKELGVRLLNRSTRRISLTHDGELYYARGEALLSELEDLNRAVSGARTKPKGVLKVNAPLVFGRKRIAPIVFNFLREYPEVNIELDLSGLPINQIENGYDVGIIIGLPPDSRLIARKLVSNRCHLCASPLYLKQFGTPKHPKELAHHQCLVARTHPDPYIWRMTKGDITESVKVHGAFSSNDGEVLMGWALGGHGLLIGGDWFIHPYLESGRITKVLEGWTLPNWDIYAVYPERAHLSARVSSFLDYLAAGLNNPASESPVASIIGAGGAKPVYPGVRRDSVASATVSGAKGKTGR